MDFSFRQNLPQLKAVELNRRMRKTACPVVWEGDGALIPVTPPDLGDLPREANLALHSQEGYWA